MGIRASIDYPGAVTKKEGIDTATPSLGSGPGVALQTENGEQILSLKFDIPV